MISINVIDDQIVGSYGETPFSVPFSKEVLDELLDLEQKANFVDTMEEYQQVITDFETVIDSVSTGYESVLETKCPYIAVDKKTGNFYLKKDGRISIVPMPKELVDRIMESFDKGLDFLPLVKLWIRFLRNPILRQKMKNGKGEDFSNRMFNFINMKYVHPTLKKEFMDNGFSEEVATKRATMYQVKVTVEGLINGYKVSREVMHKFDTESGERVNRYTRTFNPDTGEVESEGLPEFVEDRLFEPAVMGESGDAFYCEGTNGYKEPQHFIKVGCTHRLPDWSHVNTDDYQSCVPGLHLGGLKYISYYSGEIHNVFVDPMHVGAIPDDETGAIRCLQYFVHSSLAGVNGAIYHSSTYAAKTDQEWDQMLDEILNENDEKIKVIAKESNDLQAL